MTPTSPTVKKAPIRFFRVFSLSPWYSKSADCMAMYTVPMTLGSVMRLPSSSNTAISLIGHGLPTVPGF